LVYLSSVLSSVMIASNTVKRDAVAWALEES
jgi:hypothetical protein